VSAQEEVDFVIREFARYRSREDIIRALCIRNACHWEEAACFVHQVESEYHHKIQGRKRPLLVMVGCALSATGLLLATTVVYITLSGRIFYWYGVPYLGNLLELVMSLAMIAGGAAGIWKALVE